MFQTTRLLRHASYWLLENLPRAISTSSARCAAYAAPVAELWRELDSVLGPTSARLGAAALGVDRAAGSRAAGHAHRLARHPALRAGSGGGRHGRARRDRLCGEDLLRLGERIGLTWIKDQIESLAVEGQWQAAARRTMRDDLYALQRRITARCSGAKAATRPRAPSNGCVAHAASVDVLKRIVRRSANRLAAGFRHALRRPAGRTAARARMSAPELAA